MEKQLLSSELDNATGYLNRILQVACRYGHLSRHPQLVEDTSNLYLDLVKILQENCFAPPFEEIDLTEVPIDKKVSPLLTMLQGLLQLAIKREHLVAIITNTINTLYNYSAELHKIVANLTNLEVEYPRINLLQMIPSQNGIARFHLPLEAVKQALNEGTTQLSALKNKREELYKDWIYKGHQALLNQEVEHAHKCFQKAQNLKSCAEVLTLLGWTYSLQDNHEQAKKQCLQAIRLDPDYGPPYNDLGTYLLNEGNIEESLQWFELAKKAKNYQNREYPYINSARAHISQKRYTQALDEFSFALTLTPYNEELQSTVTHIRNRVENRERPHDNI